MSAIPVLRGGAFVFALALAACAASDPATDGASNPSTQTQGDCFNVSFVTGYDTVDRDTIRVRASASQQYEIDLSGPQCHEIDWTHRIVIESRPLSFMCVGTAPGQGSVAFRDPATRRTIECHVDAIRRVSEPPNGS